MLNSPHHVFLLLSMANSMGKSLFRGILDYVHGERKLNWRFHASLNQLALDWTDLQTVHNPAVIVQAHDPNFLQLLDQNKIPRVNVSSFLIDPQGPQIAVDNQAVGKLAAEHLLEMGFSSFAFLGIEKSVYSRERMEGFQTRLHELNWRGEINVQQVAPTSIYFDRPLPLAIEQWLIDLPKPIALFTATDGLARLALELCERHNIPCPDAVAVLGSDNDDVEGAISPVAISSIVIPFRSVGFLAAQTLAKQLAGATDAYKTHVRVPPVGVITRRSTEFLALGDAVVEKSIRIFRSRLDQPPTVQELASACGVSRRYLERRFRTVLGRSPLEELVKYRLREVQLMLAQTNLTVSEIAHRCGFDEPKSLHRVFRKTFGITPNQYRATFFD